jgi:hypothetical protein
VSGHILDADLSAENHITVLWNAGVLKCLYTIERYILGAIFNLNPLKVKLLEQLEASLVIFHVII